MNRFADKYSVKSNKLFNYNYSSLGNYFITICTLHHNNFFGKIIGNKMIYSESGEIANNYLSQIPTHFANVCLTASIVMPNHVHVLFHVETPDLASQLIKNKSNDLAANSQNEKTNSLKHNYIFGNETPDLASLQDNRKITLINYSHINHPDFYFRINQKSKQLLPKIIQQYKSSVTRQINPETKFFAWQSGYYDVIIQDDRQFSAAKNYIISNPLNWQKDKYFIK